MCNIAGFIYYNQNCYKLFKVKLLDFNWIETACFDEESSLIEEIDSTSADEILFLASLIVDIVTTDLNCIATKIKRTAVRVLVLIYRSKFMPPSWNNFILALNFNFKYWYFCQKV